MSTLVIGVLIGFVLGVAFCIGCVILAAIQAASRIG